MRACVRVCVFGGVLLRALGMFVCDSENGVGIH